MTRLTIVIPVYNEAENFGRVWLELARDVHSPFVALAVYDRDDDNTIPVARQIIEQGEARLRLVKNRFGPGVAAAIRTGFFEAEAGPVLIVMADLSDDLSKADAMLALYEKGYSVVVGSRYMKGGRLIGGPWLKQLLSRLAGVSLYWLRGLPTHDATNAFKIYDRAMVNSLGIESRAGFELNLELTIKAFLAGYRIAEIPATWRDRQAGQSRFRFWKWLPLYLRWYAYAFRPRKTFPQTSNMRSCPASASWRTEHRHASRKKIAL